MAENPTTTAPILTDAAGVARLLGIGLTSVYGLRAAGRLPRPVFKAGKIVRWALQGPNGLTAWIAAGCPPASRWEARR